MNSPLERVRFPQFPAWVLLFAWLLALAPAWAGEPDFLEPEQAFKLGVAQGGDGKVHLQWAIAPGYYLYRDRITVDGAGVGAVERPRGQRKDDPNFGAVEVYHDTVRVQVDPGSAGELRVGWQGCAEDGLCYPPQERSVKVSAATPGATAAMPPAAAAAVAAGTDSDGAIRRLLSERDLLWTLPLFFALGIALAFTPCVLPMVPILSGMVVGSQATPRRGLMLSLAFVLPMALVYAGLGVLAALAGSGLQALLQNAWTLLAFSAVFVVLALAMFGFFELQLPAFLRDRLARTSGTGGSLAGAAAMGALSALLVGPCMTAPLAGTLLYIAQTGNVAQGALLLLALGLGMGVPLVVISTAGARWLPRPGAWMNRVKAGFGFLLLATAIWMAQRVLPAPLAVLLWGALLTALAVTLWQCTGAASDGPGAHRLLARSGAAVAGLWGGALVLGAAAGATDPVQPLAALLQAGVAQTRPAGADFQVIEDPAVLQAKLAAAAAAGQPALVEFSADWCTSCKTIEREVFGDPQVRQALGGMVLLRADVTRSDAPQRAFMGRHQVMGPPTLMLFDAQGAERRGERLVGEFGPQDLLRRVAGGSGRS